MLTFGSLFSGIGGLDLGFERSGLRCIWQVEKNDFCRRVLRKHWPKVPQWDDVTTFTGEGFERPDIIAGGFPCQDISVSGRGDGIDGDRSGLWREFARIVGIFRPSFVVVENVAALLIRGIERVLGDLAQLGYHAEWSIVSGCSVGAPHVRKRLFLIAYSHGKLGQKGVRVEQALDKINAIQSECISERVYTHKRWMDSITRNGGSNDGVPGGVDRLTALGNAVIPQVAEIVAKRLLKVINDA